MARTWLPSPTAATVRSLVLFALLGVLLAPQPGVAQTNLTSKRGLAYIEKTYAPDNRLFVLDNTTISWYYNWRLIPERVLGPSLAFMPLIHGMDNVTSPDLEDLLNSLPASSTHLLTFNEPDGEKHTGGSDITPEVAAKAYLDYIVRFRNGPGRKWKISHPVVTGSIRGLDWLRSFNESCFRLNPTDGCPADFVSVHWYGDFGGMAAWLGQLHEFYGGNLSIFLTEIGMPGGTAHQNQVLMNESLPYLDRLEYVEGYSWFGAFRTNESNAWTGKGVSLFDDDGGLTDIGSVYLGGAANGFGIGRKGPTEPFAWEIDEEEHNEGDAGGEQESDAGKNESRGALRCASLWSLALTVVGTVLVSV